MQKKHLAIALIATMATMGATDAHSSSPSHSTTDTIQRLGASKHTLLDGIRHAEKLGCSPISAKFEVEDGKFWLSVYSAKKMDAHAEHNTLIEFKGEASAPLFDPKPDVFQDAPHVARSATQLTLLQVATLSLEDAIKRASSVQDGTVYSAIPMIKNGQPVAEIAVAKPDGKTALVDVDLRSGAARKR